MDIECDFCVNKIFLKMQDFIFELAKNVNQN